MKYNPFVAFFLSCPVLYCPFFFFTPQLEPRGRYSCFVAQMTTFFFHAVGTGFARYYITLQFSTKTANRNVKNFPRVTPSAMCVCVCVQDVTPGVTHSVRCVCVCSGCDSGCDSQCQVCVCSGSDSRCDSQCQVCVCSGCDSGCDSQCQVCVCVFRV